MKISSSSWLYKWAYLQWYPVKWFDVDSYPYRVNLCSLFWRTVLLAPLAGIFFSVVTLFTLPFYYLVVLPIEKGIKIYKSRYPYDCYPCNGMLSEFLELTQEYVQTKKNKYCPIIEVEDDHE